MSAHAHQYSAQRGHRWELEIQYPAPLLPHAPSSRRHDSSIGLPVLRNTSPLHLSVAITSLAQTGLNGFLLRGLDFHAFHLACIASDMATRGENVHVDADQAACVALAAQPTPHVTGTVCQRHPGALEVECGVPMSRTCRRSLHLPFTCVWSSRRRSVA